MGWYCFTIEPDAAVEQFKRSWRFRRRTSKRDCRWLSSTSSAVSMQTGLVYAKEAVSWIPQSFVARNAFGRTLLDTGDVGGAVRELETGVKLAPDSPEMQFALARAYMKAGRKEDAQKARAEFLKLDKVRRERRELLVSRQGRAGSGERALNGECGMRSAELKEALDPRVTP